jgi:flagellin-like protein
MITGQKGSAKTKLRWSLFPKGKRGITPIIAIILLLMMTVAVAGAAFFWLSRIQNQLQGGVESYQGTIFMQMSSRVDVVATDYDDADTNLTIIFQNTGNTKIPVSDDTDFPTTTWILKDYDQVMRCAGNWNSTSDAECQKGCDHDPPPYIDVGDTYPVVLDLDGDCAIDLADDGGKMFYFTVDFSGQTTSSGQFIAQ